MHGELGELFFFKQACLAGTFSQDHPALILNFKSLAFNPLSWPGTLHHLFWGFVITESTCRVLQHFKLSVDKNQNNYNFHKLKTAIQMLQPHLTPVFHNKSLQWERFSCTRVFCSFCPWKGHGHQASPHPTAPPASSVPRMFCQPLGWEKLSSVLPQVGQSQKKKKMAFSSSQTAGGGGGKGAWPYLPILTHTCPYHVGNISHSKGIPTACLGGYKRFSATLGKQK